MASDEPVAGCAANRALRNDVWSSLSLSVQEGSASHRAIVFNTGAGLLLSTLAEHPQHQPLLVAMQTACMPALAPVKAPTIAHSLTWAEFPCCGSAPSSVISQALLPPVLVTFAGWATTPAPLLQITAPCQTSLCALVQVYFEWETAPAPLPAPSTRRPQTTGAPVTSAEPPVNAPAPKAEHAGWAGPIRKFSCYCEATALVSLLALTACRHAV